jgi:hypothetical protein
MSLDMDIDLQERPTDSPVGFDRDIERPERTDGEVSLDRLAGVINDVLSVPSSEGLALLIQTQLARAAAPGCPASERPDPEHANLDRAALPEEVDA